MDPNSHNERIEVDLGGVASQPALDWHIILRGVAQAKCEDTIARDYWDRPYPPGAHVDPDGNGINILMHEAGYTLDPSMYEDPATNAFESLAVRRMTGDSIPTVVDGAYFLSHGKEMIDALIVDES